MNRQIRRLGIAMIMLYSLLFVQLNRIQIFGARRLNENTNNTRDILRDFGNTCIPWRRPGSENSWLV